KTVSTFAVSPFAWLSVGQNFTSSTDSSMLNIAGADSTSEQVNFTIQHTYLQSVNNRITATVTAYSNTIISKSATENAYFINSIQQTTVPPVLSPPVTRITDSMPQFGTTGTGGYSIFSTSTTIISWGTLDGTTTVGSTTYYFVRYTAEYRMDNSFWSFTPDF